ncbi:hypothetical protein H4Q26_010841 [Puccinia striiformis f. sp. tritici PST-130]|uniref:Uncharacterized protein n=1 Tax=Puccinia striiformis f. sp. tritici PST-78 TaxID=1165861 RepID=A0A0L0W401_9BASI|nr:hypothetical protein H4Q26_010841 [Puccinia striiformis f. sp. tritici PST-130]KNF06229.1 hypothetical protein PSTG_00736 [Puccinia striiformis f. sp. tritici PST-78]
MRPVYSNSSLVRSADEYEIRIKNLEDTVRLLWARTGSTQTLPHLSPVSNPRPHHSPTWSIWTDTSCTSRVTPPVLQAANFSSTPSVDRQSSIIPSRSRFSKRSYPTSDQPLAPVAVSTRGKLCNNNKTKNALSKAIAKLLTNDQSGIHMASLSPAQTPGFKTSSCASETPQRSPLSLDRSADSSFQLHASPPEVITSLSPCSDIGSSPMEVDNHLVIAPATRTDGLDCDSLEPLSKTPDLNAASMNRQIKLGSPNMTVQHATTHVSSSITLPPPSATATTDHSIHKNEHSSPPSRTSTPPLAPIQEISTQVSTIVTVDTLSTYSTPAPVLSTQPMPVHR